MVQQPRRQTFISAHIQAHSANGYSLFWYNLRERTHAHTHTHNSFGSLHFHWRYNGRISLYWRLICWWTRNLMPMKVVKSPNILIVAFRSSLNTQVSLNKLYKLWSSLLYDHNRLTLYFLLRFPCTQVFLSDSFQKTLINEVKINDWHQ
jgi:hypothetical protein